MIHLRISQPAQRWALAVLTAVLLPFTFIGCSAHRERSDFHFQKERQDQAPEVDLSLFESPELRPGEHDRDHHVVVAVSGGGHRAANFAFGVLLELESLECGDRRRDALREIDYFSTVSGGGFGVGAYLASLGDHMSSRADGENIDDLRNRYSLAAAVGPRDSPDRNSLLRQLERGYVKRAARAFFSLRATFTRIDRGDFLEDSFDRFILGAERRGSSLTLDQFWIPKGSGSVLMPAWVANSVVFQNGAIFPFTPDILREYGVSSYIHAKRRHSFESRDEELATYGVLPVSVAMKASASFPSLLPATTFGVSGRDPKNSFLHLQDGGLADNLGLISAFSLVSQLERGGGTTSLILIDAFTGETEPYSRGLGSPKFYQSLWRSTKVSLDSWHTRYRTLFRSLLPGQEPIFLGFSDIEDSAKREKIMAIGTSLDIKTSQRDLLFDAARDVVEKNKAQLCRAFFPTDTAGG